MAHRRDPLHQVSCHAESCVLGDTEPYLSLHKSKMTLRQNMKREDQQDATIRCLLLTSVSTCFGHHYAHLQENKGPVLQDVSTMCSHPARQRPTTVTNHIQQNQNNTPNAVTGPLIS